MSNRNGLVGLTPGVVSSLQLRHWVSVATTDTPEFAEEIANGALAQFESVGATVQSFTVSAVGDPAKGLQFVIIIAYVFTRHLPLDKG